MQFLKGNELFLNKKPRKKGWKNIESKENIIIHTIVPLIEAVVKPHIRKKEVWLANIIRFLVW